MFTLALLIFMFGDSTTYGYVPNRTPSIAYSSTAMVLQDVLTHLPTAHPLSNATVLNLGVGGSSTQDWAGRLHDYYCLHQTLPILVADCPGEGPLAIAAINVYGQPDIVLVTLGTNDSVWGVTAVDGEAYLASIQALVAPAKVLIATPFATIDPVRKRHLDRLVPRMRAAGLVSGPDFYADPLPLSDEVHLTDGGYTAAAGFWLDKLLALY